MDIKCIDQHNHMIAGKCPNCESTEFGIHFNYGELNEIRVKCLNCGSEGKTTFVPYLTEAVEWE